MTGLNASQIKLTVEPLFQELALRNSNINVLNQTVDPVSELTQIGDPFLGQNTNDPHVRQGSTDSGLGGMGSGSSFMSRTPEEFLSNVSEMDASQDGHRAGDFNNMDMGTMDTDQSNMDSEDLVPSLQPDDISNELLNDVETVLNNKMDDSLLTWFVDPDERPHYAASHLGLRCLPMPFFVDARHKWVNR
ncbi:hypothetical protein DPMN_135052 [Dreissena polymorpha]|uniref:Uncharacterized protein n=1 Tax=Dreissena polymorpha TaxID=45954 RepID=A0A9D4G134_DREPO|nr:hypothetical protein DPMN_135052 [Dreissena polymorpha]